MSLFKLYKVDTNILKDRQSKMFCDKIYKKTMNLCDYVKKKTSKCQFMYENVQVSGTNLNFKIFFTGLKL